LPPPQYFHRQDVTTSWLDGENLRPAALFLQQTSFRRGGWSFPGTIMRDSQFAKNNKA
jgi:hypothetical protein